MLLLTEKKHHLERQGMEIFSCEMGVGNVDELI